MTKTVESLSKLAKDLNDLREYIRTNNNDIWESINSLKKAKARPVKGAEVTADLETKRQLAAAAQSLGLHSADELAQIVLHAFLEMYEEDGWITFPLAIQQVENVA
jgi:hypothetical protein